MKQLNQTFGNGDVVGIGSGEGMGASSRGRGGGWEGVRLGHYQQLSEKQVLMACECESLNGTIINRS